MPMTSAPTLRRMTAARRAAMLALAGLASVLLLAGCGGDTPADNEDATPSAEATSEAPAGTAIEVTETEFDIKLSKSTVAAGDYTFAISNDGSLPHNLAIQGPGVDGETSDTFDGGQSGELTVTLQEGKYTVWCAVGNHRAQGMETTLNVTG